VRVGVERKQAALDLGGVGLEFHGTALSRSSRRAFARLRVTPLTRRRARRRVANATKSSALRVLITSSGCSHALRAIPMPSAILSSPSTECASGPISIRAVLPRELGEAPVEVQAMRVGVELHGHAQLGRPLKDGVHIDREGLTREQQAARGMPEYGDVRILERLEHAVGHLRLVHPERECTDAIT
jgi:hypothetical protein